MMTCSAWLSLVLLAAIAFPVICQEFAGCRESYFLSNGDCLPCPANCITCISKTNCSKCSSNYYGLTCQQECLQECEDICHKKYGYCTYGCVDGQFPEEDEAHCSNCPINCTLCKSSSACIMCHPGRHGKTCEHPCENNCDTCDQMSGNCMVCAQGYFNRDGRCKKCPVGCIGCFKNNNCSVCKSDYSRLHDGQCIMKCPRDESEMSHVSIGQDESGITIEQTINDTCKCSQECPYKTTTPCIRSMPCPEGHHCSTDDNDTVTCAAILTYECIHKFQSSNGYYHQPNCSSKNSNTFIKVFCLTSPGTVSIENVSTYTTCLPAPTDVDTGPDLHACQKTVSMPLLVVLLVALCITMVMILIILYHRRRYMELFLRTSMRKDTCVEEMGAMKGPVSAGTGSLDTESHQQITPLIRKAKLIIKKQDLTQETFNNIVTGQRTELTDVAAFKKRRTGSLDQKTFQQNTPRTPEQEPLRNEHKHKQEPTNTMKTEEITKRDDNAATFTETTSDSLVKKPNQQNTPITLETESLTNKQKHTREPQNNLVAEKRTELDNPEGFAETMTPSLDTKPYQQSTPINHGLETPINKPEHTREPSNTIVTEAKNEQHDTASLRRVEDSKSGSYSDFVDLFNKKLNID